MLDGVRHFASLWDWDAPGGFVHVSRYLRGEEVRTAPAVDLSWNGERPPPEYASAVAAYETLLKAHR